MALVTKEEVLKIARLSYLDIHEDELESLVKQLQGVLTYAERVQKAAEFAEEPSNRNVNVFREDMVVKTDPAPILAQAPEREEDFFVVPVVIESKK